MKSSDIIKKLELIYKPSMGKRTVLIDGKWGIGKTYTYAEYIKKNKYQSIYISLFNINSLEEIDKKIILKNFFKDKSKYFESKILQKINPKSFLKKCFGINIGEFSEILNIANIFEILDINNLNFSEDTVICFDDLERLNKNIDIESVLGKIEQLHNKVKIAIICNSKKLSEENKKVFNEYKEKVIDNNYMLDELDVEFIKDFIKELNLKDGSKETLIKYFLENGNNNLRYLKKIKDSYIEIKEVCNQEEWFLNKEKEIIEAIACLEAENCFQLYFKKGLEKAKENEEYLSKINQNRKKKSDEELKKEINFLDEIYGDVRKIVELLHLYSIKNIDIKKELQKYFSNEESYKKLYQLCDLYFLKDEIEILKSFEELKVLYNEQFEGLSFKYKFYGFIVLKRYLKDLQLRNLCQNDYLTLEKEKLKKYIKNQLKQGIRIDYLRKIEPYLNDFDKEETNILKNLKKEIDIEFDEEINQEILDCIKNKNFTIMDKYYAGEFKLSYTNNEEIKDFFDVLLFNSCPEEYWNYFKEVFSMLDRDSKDIIVQILEENLKNENSYILKIRNQLIKKNLGYKNI